MKAIAFTSYNGTGKTYLATATARLYAQETGNPTFLADVVHGANVACRLGHIYPGPAPLSELMLHEVDFLDWHGVDVCAIDYDAVRGFHPDDVQEFYRKQVNNHSLSVFDVRYPHDFAHAALDICDEIYVVAGSEDDWADGAAMLAEKLDAKIVFNRRAGLNHFAFADIDVDLWVPEGSYAKVGDAVLKHILGDEWDGRSFLSRLFGG